MSHKDPEVAKAYHKTYRDTHRKERKAYYFAHMDEIKAYDKVYGVSHHKERVACAKKHNAKHPEERKAYAEMYRATHREESKARRKVDYATNVIEIICVQCKKRASVSVQTTGKFCSRKCADQHNSGPNNPNWNDGASFEPYCPKFNEEFKERVRTFFDGECLICGKSEADLGRKLSVHHVDYDKKVCCNDRPPAFAAVCIRHNVMANYDRERWGYMFHYIIDEIYGGKCYFPRGDFFGH
jgi:hypothetical protein